EVIRRRLPKDQTALEKPVALADIPLDEGWLGLPSTWGKDGRRPTIAAVRGFSGDRAETCWFPSERAAAAWQAFVSPDREITLAAPAGLGDKQKFVVHPAGSPVPAAVNLSNKLAPT